jgi:hypothetical protein
MQSTQMFRPSVRSDRSPMMVDAQEGARRRYMIASHFVTTSKDSGLPAMILNNRSLDRERCKTNASLKTKGNVDN